MVSNSAAMATGTSVPLTATGRRSAAGHPQQRGIGLYALAHFPQYVGQACAIAHTPAQLVPESHQCQVSFVPARGAGIFGFRVHKSLNYGK
jgi:hypothetical protein